MRTQLSYSLILLPFILISCSGPGNKSNQEQSQTNDEPTQGTVGYVELNDPLEDNLVAEGLTIFEEKCSNCHELDASVKIGPGWGGITNRRAPEWIMTMILNVNTMVQVDSVAHSLLVEAGVQMPDQRLSVDKARSVLEFMRGNDLDQVGTKDEGVNSLAD